MCVSRPARRAKYCSVRAYAILGLAAATVPQVVRVLEYALAVVDRLQCSLTKGISSVCACDAGRESGLWTAL